MGSSDSYGMGNPGIPIDRRYRKISFVPNHFSM